MTQGSACKVIVAKLATKLPASVVSLEVSTYFIEERNASKSTNLDDDDYYYYDYRIIKECDFIIH
jgi:hypothetical protein